VLLSSKGEDGVESNKNSATTDGQQTEIMKLAKEGQSAEKIAETLSIPQGEVRLVLDLRNKFSQMAKI
jgi:DNA-binding NarL/FixJ family response regulator